MGREFSIGGIMFDISNVDDSQKTATYKYDLEMYVPDTGYWVRLCGCRTIAEGKERALEYLHELSCL